MRFEVQGPEGGVRSLREMLEVLGPRAAASRWTVRSEEDFWVTGPASGALEALAAKEAIVDGERLLALATEVHQPIWGVFEGRMPGEAKPWITIEAFDGTVSVETAEVDVVRAFSESSPETRSEDL